MWRTIIFLFTLAAATTLPASQSGMWLDGQGGEAYDEALALSTEVEIQVTGRVGLAQVRQRFFNQTGQWAEGVYRFPLPDGSAVEQLEIRVADRLIEGEIQERGEARTTYETARAEGRMAGLVEQTPDHLFSTRVANIPPGEVVEVVIGFTQPVRYRHGRFSLEFPTTSAPRFRPHGELGAAVRERIVGTSPRGLPQRPMALTVDLRPGVALSSIEATHHDVATQALEDGWLVSLAGDHDRSGRDFELVWTPENSRTAEVAAFTEMFGGQEHLMIDLVPPQAFEAVDTLREMILVMDVSGSMAEAPIAQAKESLHYALASLEAGDRFNVIAFNHEAEALYASPRAFSAERLLEATAWVDALMSDGGTDMGPPLAKALGHSVATNTLRQVVFITDGMVGNEDELLARTASELGDSRLFTVGIGHGVNGRFLRRLAQSGRGSYTAIAETSRIAERMSELVLQLESPVIHDIEVIWPQPVEFLPESLPDLYVGQPLTVMARTDRLRGNVLVRGTSNGLAFERIVALADFQPGPGVASQWGRSRIDALENALSPLNDRAENAAEILRTARAYSLVSSQTSLVAVDRTPVRSQAAAVQRFSLETSPAHGRSGILQALPATDAGSVPAFIRGGVALLLVVLLLFQKRFNREGDPS